jgi:formate/nitrite transporter
MRGRALFKRLAENWFFVLLGSLFVAYFLAVKTGVGTAGLPLARLEGIAHKKAVDETETQILLRGLGCNWLVCLGVWMALAADDIAGKVLAIFFPIMAFVAMGFDHVVANMFFIPAAIWAGVPDITWWDAVHNWIFAFLGNLAGAVIFVAGAYWFLYAQDEPGEPGDTPSGAPERTGEKVPA